MHVQNLMPRYVQEMSTSAFFFARQLHVQLIELSINFDYNTVSIEKSSCRFNLDRQVSIRLESKMIIFALVHTMDISE
jgi:hypothetical protein